MKLESGKKSLSEEHSNLDWLGYRMFVQIEADKTQGRMYPRVAPVEETNLPGEAESQEPLPVFPDKFRSALEETDLYLCVNGL